MSLLPRVCPFSVVVFVASAVWITHQTRKNRRTAAPVSSSSDDDASCNATAAQVVFVLGAPGVGKGTQCQLLTERLTTTNNKNNNIIDDDTVEVTNNSNTTNNQWVHLSAGDLLRAERSRADSVLALEINACIAAGQLVASTVTCQLLTNAMRDAKAQAVGTVTRIHFLIDGFPRSQSNIEAWNATVNPNQYPVVAVLNYVCPEETLIGRLLERGKSSGRADDNLTSVKARFETFAKETAPLLEFYQNQQHHIPVYTIATDKPVEAVYQDTVQYFQ